MPKKKSISKVLKKIEEKELIIKTKPEWVKSALVNKAKYQKKYSDSIKKNDDFWKIEVWYVHCQRIATVRPAMMDVLVALLDNPGSRKRPNQW